jgi:hypothetical protein
MSNIYVIKKGKQGQYDGGGRKLVDNTGIQAIKKPYHIT